MTYLQQKLLSQAIKCLYTSLFILWLYQKCCPSYCCSPPSACLHLPSHSHSILRPNSPLNFSSFLWTPSSRWTLQHLPSNFGHSIENCYLFIYCFHLSQNCLSQSSPCHCPHFFFGSSCSDLSFLHLLLSLYRVSRCCSSSLSSWRHV